MSIPPLTRNHRVVQIVLSRRLREVAQLTAAQLQLAAEVCILQNALQRARQLIVLLLLDAGSGAADAARVLLVAVVMVAGTGAAGIAGTDVAFGDGRLE